MVFTPQQLDEFLNKCVYLWWKPRGIEVKAIYYTNEDLPIRLYPYIEDRDHSIHDLFSVESWLMEFVKWEDKMLPNWYYIGMCKMTSEQKIQYFLDNALLPNDKCDHDTQS